MGKIDIKFILLVVGGGFLARYLKAQLKERLGEQVADILPLAVALLILTNAKLAKNFSGLALGMLAVGSLDLLQKNLGAGFGMSTNQDLMYVNQYGYGSYPLKANEIVYVNELGETRKLSPAMMEVPEKNRLVLNEFAY